MREILFRGKRIDNGEWVEGDLIHRQVWQSYLAIIRVRDDGFDNYTEYEVDPSTVGQYTGLSDKNGKKIFEGDIISSGCLCNFFVEYSEEDAEYQANFGDSSGSLATYLNPKEATVIGNIHDNFELLEAGV